MFEVAPASHESPALPVAVRPEEPQPDSYAVSDLLPIDHAGTLFFNDEPEITPMTRRALDRLVQLVKYRCAPGTWNDEGRRVWTKGHVLVVLAPFDVRREVETMLADLRREVRSDPRRISVSWSEAPVDRVVRDLAWVSGFGIEMEPLARDLLDTAAPVTLVVRHVSLHDVIELVMMQVAPDGALVHETKNFTLTFRVSRAPFLRIHPVRDLLGETIYVALDKVLPAVTPAECEEADRLIDLVRYRCAPGRWGNGDWKIFRHEANLVVSAPITVQHEIAEYLDELRDVAWRSR